MGDIACLFIKYDTLQKVALFYRNIYHNKYRNVAHSSLQFGSPVFVETSNEITYSLLIKC